MRLGRRDFLLGGAAAAAAHLACRASLPGGDVIAERVEVAVPDLDPAHDGLRVAQLSDLHVGKLTPHGLVRSALTAVNGFAPDLVVLTGDYLTHDHVIHRHTSPRLIREQLGGIAAPTVAVLGNHDCRVDPGGAVAALEHLGYRALRNQNTTLRLRGASFTVVGIDDLVTRHADPVLAMKGAARGSRLYLAHVPVTAEALRSLGEPALVLSGHTHGGQLNFPPVSMLFAYKSGLYRLGRVQLYVNRGVGNSWMPLRVNAPPEVTLFTLRSGAVLHAVART